MLLVEQDVEASMKVVVVGNGSVGKTSLIKRFCTNVFSDDYKKTIGVDFLEKELQLPELGTSVRMMLWDTAGQEEFDTITSNYYRGADAAVLAFASDNRDSFEKIRSWYQKVTKECGNIPMVLIQNKVDLIDQAQVRTDESEALATELKVRLYRTSVKQNLNVQEVFSFLAQTHLQRRQTEPAPPPRPRSVIPQAVAITQPPHPPTFPHLGPVNLAPAAQPQTQQPDGPVAVAPTKRRGHKDTCTII
ncbi:putative Ras-related protein Rab-23 [Paratrimastix pyriformis]|uniref:Ras-related protein Rab-23 n=1 Tax=Paratrimastix pyriformis TaxID=342808 RepID=A0ABQ8UZG0_9EUKA|nr:putative Ras-related protein Rab-23 [Paratrimastix pyriformis]